MPKGQKKKGQKKTKKEDKIKKTGLFQSTPRNFRIGGNVQHKKDLTRYVRWPRYIMIQRQKKILMQRLKIPPPIHQFSKIMPKNIVINLFKLLKKYSPEGKKEKKARMLESAKEKLEIEALKNIEKVEKKEEEKAEKAKQEGKKKEKKQEKIKKEKEKPHILKCGLNHVTNLVENKEAKLVVIAHDVDPIELVVWLPQLCRKQEVPFCIVKNKARLGKLVKKKTASCVALTSVRPEDKGELDMLVTNFRTNFNENIELRKTEGGLIKGIKSRHKDEKKQKAREMETVQKSGL